MYRVSGLLSKIHTNYATQARPAFRTGSDGKLGGAWVLCHAPPVLHSILSMVASLVPRPLPDFISQPWAWGGGYCVARVSNLKYESVRIDFKAVVFIRANPGKKQTTDGSGSHVIFIQKQCTFPKW